MASHHKFRQIGFAHLMEHLPFHTFRRWVQRYLSKYPTKLFSHLDQFLCMAFAQLTCHESLCNTETCLRCDRTIALTSSQSQQGLPTAPAAYQVLRCRTRQASGISSQQLRLTCADHRSALSLSLAGRTILQMDQTASSYQAFLRNY